MIDRILPVIVFALILWLVIRDIAEALLEKRTRNAWKSQKNKKEN